MISDKNIADKIAAETTSGYWAVNGKYFFNKQECLVYATEVAMPVSFHFFDDFYKTLNWTVEPSKTLTELYKARAEQLRSKYDYIIVAFSGGADSSTVIDSFLDNGIKLDEIVTSYPISAIDILKDSFNVLDRSPKNLMFEYTESVKPKMAKISQYHPDVKLTVLDHTSTAIDVISNNNLNMLPVGGFGAAPSLAGHYMIGQRLRELSEKKQKVCFLIGVDKPRMGFNPNSRKFGIYFDDVSTCWGHYTDESLGGFQPSTEYFYYTIDMPAILQKQAHQIKNIMKTIFDEDQNLFVNQGNDLYYMSKKGNFVFNVHHNFFKKILYPNWDTAIFQAKKPTSFFFQESAFWFTNTKLTDQRSKDYHKGQVLESCHGISDNYIVYNSQRLPLKFLDFSTSPIPIQ